MPNNKKAAVYVNRCDRYHNFLKVSSSGAELIHGFYINFPKINVKTVAIFRRKTANDAK